MSAELVGYDEIRTFFEDGGINEVLSPVKSGKEATVYCCRACKGRGDAYFAHVCLGGSGSACPEEVPMDTTQRMRR